MSTFAQIVVNLPTVRDYDLASLQGILYGASPMPQAVMETALKVFPACGFFQGYGPYTLKEWIHDASAIKPGVRMPPFEMSDQDLQAIANYLYSLK